MAWKKIGNIAALSLAFIFAACGGDSGNNASTEDPSSSPSTKSGTSTTPYSQENLNYSGMTYKTYEGLVAEQPCELSLNLTVAHVSSTNEDYLCSQVISSGKWLWQPYQGGNGSVMGENGRIYETFTDSRDGHVYKMVTIGTQTWMAENLDFVTDRSHCFKNATGTGDEECGKNSFGRYYTWSDAMDSIGRFSNDGLGCGYLPNYQAEKCVAVTSKESIRGICPQGWHLPDTTEWNTLLNYVGNPPFKIVKQGLKYFEGATDAYGFSAIPTSYWLFNDCHHCYELPFGEGIYFWAATPNVYDKSVNRGFQFNIGGGSIASDWRMREYFDYSGSLNESYAIPVRCVRDDAAKQSDLNQIINSSSSSFYVELMASSSSAFVYATPCKTQDADMCKYETLIDLRDNQIYKTVKIGAQTWMAQDLNFEIDNSECYSDIADSCKKYGRQYTWAAAMIACPDGWHLPNKEDFYLLVKSINEKTGTASPKALISCNDWIGAESYQKQCEDSYGFSARPNSSAYRCNGIFDCVAYWTSSSDSLIDSRATYYEVAFQTSMSFPYTYEKTKKTSVRCIQD